MIRQIPQERKKVWQSLDFIDDNETRQIFKCELRLFQTGKDGPGLSLSDNNGEVRSILSVDTNASRLSLYDQKGVPAAVVIVDENGAGLDLYDDTSKPRASLFGGGDASFLIWLVMGMPNKAH